MRLLDEPVKETGGVNIRNFGSAYFIAAPNTNDVITYQVALYRSPLPSATFACAEDIVL